ncbi:hypothetical protein J3459_008050 [Metarhizium acridum]|uniref:DUF4604 domain-containing protein n=1 Tax=Metarhizium acridum (strain CQMa 102) TaxID=655827 RepID=E9DVE3_METAQ|nr:uncharacterized protein MAC_01591 [Metarhizium acridum CQMa 102]EFY92320.1 hypothetical protein MAC_01591 [Metarhizium acridum CQMa 102]KAG8424095.1 hypothetical protein J3458_000927 [Metarhizium acridum]KAG8426521.1 hypothetical protein J3459_008050 [Metarhizium acridum]
MPEKITSKNLSYNASLPPFLARLHAQSAGAAGPDPLLAAQKRSAKKRSDSEEAEDAPLVVDEHGNAVDLQLEKDGTVKGTETKSGQDETGGAELDEKAVKRDAAATASIGARKRKVGKVIGERASHGSGNDGKDQQEDKLGGAQAPVDKKVKKKAKKIKLSFDEDEG